MEKEAIFGSKLWALKRSNAHSLNPHLPFCQATIRNRQKNFRMPMDAVKQRDST
jgi:hypothetical protein